MANQPVSVLCIYRVKEGKENAFETILRRHWPTLDGLGLVTPERARWYRSKDAEKRTCYLEMFTWKDESAPNQAHELPEVMAVWEPMGELTESMEFLDLETLS